MNSKQERTGGCGKTLRRFVIRGATLPPQTYQPDHLSGILLPCGMGNLILRGASCLDAFSTYPVRT